MKDALDVWEPLAVAMLIDAAKRYNDTVIYGQLAAFVQAETGITHNAVLSNWIGNLLARVIKYCDEHETPQLSSLCVTQEGTVGEGYRAALTAREKMSYGLDDLDDRAALTRLECYRYFGAELPPGGGEPTLTPQAKAARAYRQAQAKRDEPPKVCPTCFTELPVIGLCDNCAQPVTGCRSRRPSPRVTSASSSPAPNRNPHCRLRIHHHLAPTDHQHVRRSDPCLSLAILVAILFNGPLAGPCMSLLMSGAEESVAALLGTADRSTNIELVTCVSSGFCGASLLSRYRLVNSRGLGGR